MFFIMVKAKCIELQTLQLLRISAQRSVRSGERAINASPSGSYRENQFTMLSGVTSFNRQ